MRKIRAGYGNANNLAMFAFAGGMGAIDLVLVVDGLMRGEIWQVLALGSLFAAYAAAIASLATWIRRRNYVTFDAASGLVSVVVSGDQVELPFREATFAVPGVAWVPGHVYLKFPDGHRIQCGLLAQGRGYDALKSFRRELARHGVNWYEV